MASNEPNVSERLAYTFANWQHYYFAYEFGVAIMRDKGEVTTKEYRLSKNGHRLAEAILDNHIQSLVPEEWRPSEKLARQNHPGKVLHAHYSTFKNEKEFDGLAQKVKKLYFMGEEFCRTGKIPNMTDLKKQ